MKTKTYIVRAGDTLPKIAGYFDLPLADFLALNPQISEKNGISPRQAIQIPDREPDKLSLHAVAATEEEPLWIKIALREMASGVMEFPDPEENPRILEYLESCGITGPVEGKTGDEIPWCSAFVNWCLKEAGLHGTDDARAKSWETWGQDLDKKPRHGCIVVYPGHVGFYFGDYNEEKISLLGGNQSDEVNISPHSKAKIVACRWPS